MAGADLLTVKVDGDPFIVLVDHDVERLRVKFPATRIGRDIGRFVDRVVRLLDPLVLRIVGGGVVVADHVEGHLALGRQEYDVVTVVQLDVQLIHAGVVQDVVLAVVDQNVVGIRDLGLLVGAESGLDALAVGKDAVHIFRVPFGAGRRGDADRRNIAAAAVDQRDRHRHLRLRFAAGRQRQQKNGAQQQHQNPPCAFHNFPPQIPFSFPKLRSVRLLRHAQKLVMAQLHIAEADKDPVRHGTAPCMQVGKRPEAELIQMRLHVQKQTAAGDEIHLKNVVRKRRDR